MADMIVNAKVNTAELNSAREKLRQIKQLKDELEAAPINLKFRLETSLVLEETANRLADRNAALEPEEALLTPGRISS